MRYLRWTSWAAMGLLLLLSAPPVAAQQYNDVRALPIRQQGDAFCFTRSVSFGAITIAGDRCYTTYLVHMSNGGFLGFGPTNLKVPRGQIVRMGTPAGAKLRGQFFYLLPLGVRLSIPVDGIQFVLPQFRFIGGQLVFSVPAADGRLAELRSGVLPKEKD